MKKFNEDMVTVKIKLSPASDPFEATFEGGSWSIEDDEVFAEFLNELAPGFTGPYDGFSAALVAADELRVALAEYDATVEVTGQPSQKWVNAQGLPDSPGLVY